MFLAQKIKDESRETNYGIESVVLIIPMSPTFLRNQTFREAFETSAQANAELTKKNIIRWYILQKVQT